MTTTNNIRRSFTNNVNINNVATIKAAPADTCFIMMQRQPADMWDPEDTLDLTSYDIWRKGSEQDITEAWQYLNGKIGRAADRGAIDVFCKTEGRDFTSITIFRGRNVETYTVCGKEKALELAY